MSFSYLSKKKPLLTGLTLATSLLAGATTVQAANWSSTSFVAHSGDGYELGREDRTIFTFEHISGWNYGKNFFFIDVTEPNEDSSSATGWYGEYSPSLSLSKVLGKDMSFSFVKDVSLAGTLEMNTFGDAKLVGLTFDLNIPTVPVASISLYNRYTRKDGNSDSAPQITMVWMKPFSIGSTSWVFEGFLDYAFAEEEVGKEANMITAPRLWLDIGALFDAPKTLYTGIEYSMWNNKFGVDGVNERVPQLSVKWTF